MATGNSGAGLGLQIAGLGAGLAGQIAPTAQSRRDKSISQGQEDPAIAALRKRLAEQNAQTAMAVAASQQGVNPALAQRNAQQALAQQQVRTNAQLAQANQQSSLEARRATRGTQARQVGGALLGAAQGLNALGTGFSADAALSATPEEGEVELPAISQQAAPLTEAAQGLAVPPSSSVQAPPMEVPVQENPFVDAMNAAAPSERQIPADQLQMRGEQAMLTSQPTAPELPVRAAGQLPTAPVQETPIPAPIGAETQERAVSEAEAVRLLPPEVVSSPEVEPYLNAADNLEASDPSVAAALRRFVLGNLNG